MTNNWDIFTADGIAMDTGDVLLIADYYAEAAQFQLDEVTVDSNAIEITEALAEVQTREASEVTALIAGEYGGYQFDALDSTGLLLRTAVMDFADSEFVTFVLVTTSQAEQDDITPLFIDIIASLEKGVVFEQVSTLDLDLPETYVREEDGFTMSYPDGWAVGVNAVGQSKFVTITMGHEFGMDAPPTIGQPSAIIAYGTMEALTGLPQSMLNPETNAIRVVQQIIGAQPQDITSIEIKGYRAAQVISTSPNFDNWFVAIMLDDSHFIAANMFTAPQADEDFAGTVMEMLTESTWDTIEAVPETVEPDGDGLETFTSGNSGLTLEHPAGWSDFDISSEILVLINVDEAFAKVTSQETPDSGQVVATIFTHRLVNTLGEDFDDLLDYLNTTVFTDGVDDLEAIEIDEIMIYMAEGKEDDADKLVMLVPIGDNYIFLSAVTASDEMDDFRDVLIDIALSITIED